MLVPFALVRGMVGLRVVLLLCLGIFFLRFTPSLGAAGVAQPDASQISVLTWNIPVYKEKIEGWIADFKQGHPDFQVEWLDKKGTEWGTF